MSVEFFVFFSVPPLHQRLDSTQQRVDVCLQLSVELSAEGRLVICLKTKQTMNAPLAVLDEALNQQQRLTL